MSWSTWVNRSGKSWSSRLRYFTAKHALNYFNGAYLYHLWHLYSKCHKMYVCSPWMINIIRMATCLGFLCSYCVCLVPLISTSYIINVYPNVLISGNFRAVIQWSYVPEPGNQGTTLLRNYRFCIIFTLKIS